MRATAVMRTLTERVSDQAARHNFVLQPVMRVEVMNLLKVDYRNCGSSLGLRGLDEKDRDAFCRDLSSLLGAAQLVVERCKQQGLHPYIISCGIRPSCGDAGYCIAIDVTAN